MNELKPHAREPRTHLPELRRAVPSSPDSAGSATSKLLGAAILLYLAYLLRNALIPILLAAALAAVAAPLIRQMQCRLRMPRWLAALLTYLGYLAIFAGIGLISARTLAPDLATLAGNLPQSLHQFIERLFQGEELHAFGRILNARELTDGLLAGLAKFAPKADDAFQTVILGFSAAMGVILTLVLLAYFLFDAPRILSGMLWLVPPIHRARAQRIALRAAPIVGQYVRGLVVITLYAIVLSWVATRFILNLPHAALLATAVGLLEMIPVIGPIVSTAMIGLLAIQQMTWAGFVGFALFATILRVSIDQLVGPLVLGRAMRLPPVVIILSFLVGGALLGALGVLIAVPAAAAVKVVLESLYECEA